MKTDVIDFGPVSKEKTRRGDSRKSVNLRDLASLASVDASTVSRALNNDPRISPDTAKTIRQLAEEMGYRPRPLRSKFAKSIGIVVTSTERARLGDQFQERIAWAAQRLLGDQQRHVNLECVVPDELGNVQLPALVVQNRVDGVLLTGSPPVALAEQIRELNMPAVAINDSVERLGVSCVRSEPGPAIRQAILHLAARGHRKFGLLMKRMDYPTAQAKHRAYVTSLEEIGIRPDPAWFVTELHEDISGGRSGVRQLLSRGSLPTAILCENDWVAMGAIHELQARHIRIPGDISVMGHDNLWICDQLEPKLTSIHRAEDVLVSNAIDLLIGQIERNERNLKEVLVEGVMVWRESTGTAPDRAREQA